MGGESGPQLRAIAKEIDLALRKHAIKDFIWEGVMSSGRACRQAGWLVLDLGSIVIHVLGETERAYYNLEELWGKGAIVYHY